MEKTTEITIRKKTIQFYFADITTNKFEDSGELGNLSGKELTKTELLKDKIWMRSFSLEKINKDLFYQKSIRPGWFHRMKSSNTACSKTPTFFRAGK